MIIHVVQQGETIQSIARFYGVSEARLIQDNGLESSDGLVVGQSIIILFPLITYTVREGDSFIGIANAFNVSVMQLLQNNPYLSDQEYLTPGDIIAINYSKDGTITTHGNAVPYINKNTLRRTLPYLTYLSVLNYTAGNEGEIISYYDDTEIIQLAKEYNAVPLMLLTTLTIQGEANIGFAYDLLLNENFQNIQIENILRILRSKGYSGINISLEYVNISNLQIYEAYFTKLANRLNEEGFLVFAIINPDISVVDNEVVFTRVDYSLVDQLAHSIIFMNFEWAKSINPPAPISSINNINVYLDFLMEFIPPDQLILGLATIGYDWELPFSAGISGINSLTLDRAIDLARNMGVIIQFDEVSQTPFFRYTIDSEGYPIDHIVWFIDARSINALLGLITDNNLLGTSIWNIAIYNPQLWLLISSQFDIIKYQMNV